MHPYINKYVKICFRIPPNVFCHVFLHWVTLPIYGHESFRMNRVELPVFLGRIYFGVAPLSLGCCPTKYRSSPIGSPPPPPCRRSCRCPARSSTRPTWRSAVMRARDGGSGRVKKGWGRPPPPRRDRGAAPRSQVTQPERSPERKFRGLSQ